MLAFKWSCDIDILKRDLNQIFPVSVSVSVLFVDNWRRVFVLRALGFSGYILTWFIYQFLRGEFHIFQHIICTSAEHIYWAQV